MVTRRFNVDIPDGQHLGFSRDTDGAYRAHLFDNDTNRLVGHAELLEENEDEAERSGPYVSSSEEPEARELTPEEIAQALEALALLVLVIASLASAAAPHVRRWWEKSALSARAARARGRSAARRSRLRVVNAVRSTWRRASGPRIPAVYEVGDANEGPRNSTSAELEVAFQAYRARMSGAEAQERFIAALLARAFSDEQMRLLRTVTIEDEDGEMALGDLLEPPTARQIEEAVRFMLERNPSMLHEDSLASLSQLFRTAPADRKEHPLRQRRLGPSSGSDNPRRENEPDAG